MPKVKPDKSKEPVMEAPPSFRWIYFLFLFILFWLFFSRGESNIKEITWKEFRDEMLLKGDVSKVDVVNNEIVEVYIKSESTNKEEYKNIPTELLTKEKSMGPHYYFNIGSVEVFHEDLAKAQELLSEDKKITVTYSKRKDWFGDLLSWLLPVLLLIIFWMYIFRGATSNIKGTSSTIFNFGQSKARIMEKGHRSKITFQDVAGLDAAKEEIYEMVKFLKSPDRYKRLGAKIPKGVLLVGPPGTGKTLLAKAVAGEAGVPFFSLSGSEFIEMFVGVGASRMRDLFEKAKARAPSIIFIDEIDTIGRTRGKVNAFQSNDERESTLNQLLAELDGFDTDTNVIVLAATNRGDILDPALLRPGRFDRHVHLELPNIKEREEIFSVHMKPLLLSKEVDAAILAKQTPGFSGADIANICNEAALIAARSEKEKVEKEDFEKAIDRVIGGLENKSKIISPEEKKRIAYHEAGHVTASWFLKKPQQVMKVTIIPRGRSLGAAWYLPEEHQIITKSQFFDSLCMALGGRVAEELIFDEVSSNAVDDLEKATKLAYAMVANYGLGKDLRNISYYDSTGRTEQAIQKPYSEKTAELIDQEVQKLIDDAHAKTTEILNNHLENLHVLAKALIEKEVVYKEEIKKIFLNLNSKNLNE